MQRFAEDIIFINRYVIKLKLESGELRLESTDSLHFLGSMYNETVKRIGNLYLGLKNLINEYNYCPF